MTKTTIKLLAFYTLIWVVGTMMVELLLRDLTFWWWVPITITAFAILNIAASRVMPVKADRKELLLALVIAMILQRALFFWWRP